MNALLNYLDTRSVHTLFSLNTALQNKHALVTTYKQVSGKGMLHIARKTPKYSKKDDIYNDNTLTILDEDLKVVSMAPPLVMPISTKEVLTLPITDDMTVTASDLLIGKLITVSLYKRTYMLSTKKSIHASEPIHANSKIQTQEIFMDLLDRIDPYCGLDGLFKTNRGGIDCSKLSYTFIISPRSGVFTDKFLDYDLFLVALYDKANHKFLNVTQIASLLSQLNGAATTRRFLQPRYQKVYSSEQLETTFDKFTRSPFIRGLYLTDDYSKSAYWVKTKKPSINPENYMQDLVGAYLRNDYLSLIQLKAKNKALAPVVQACVDTYKIRALSTYKKTKDIRTKHAFHKAVYSNRSKSILYALYEKKIKSVNELQKVFTIRKFIRLIMEEYGTDYIKALIETQEAEKGQKGDISDKTEKYQI